MSSNSKQFNNQANQNYNGFQNNYQSFNDNNIQRNEFSDNFTEKQDGKKNENDQLGKKINLYTLKFLDEICEQLGNKREAQNIYINTKEAFEEKNNNLKKANSGKKLSPKKSINKNPNNNHALFDSNERNIQARSSFENKVHPLVNENVIRIQRAFKRFYLKNRSLPENFFFTQKILKYQFEKRYRNFEENYKILFPLSDKCEKISELNNTIDTIKTNKYKTNLNSNENLLISNLIHNPYEDGKIHIFAKILDIDIINDTSDVYEETWASSFLKVFNNCIKNKSPVQLIELGNSHTAILNSKGKVYTFGWNNNSQCGVPINSSLLESKELAEGKFHDFDEHNNIKLKSVYSLKGVKTPQIDEIITAKETDCGEDHTLVLDTEGNVWSFGLNLNGQLGLGHNKSVNRPEKIPKFCQNKIKHVISEGDISFAISENGESFMWPIKNSTGNICYSPKFLNLPEKISWIACGTGFALFLNANGMVYSMGRSNTYGQLGHGDTQPRLKPTLIETFHLNNDRVSQISCGNKHSVAKTFTNKAYTWGLGASGQLGHNNFKNYTIPYQVVIENTPYMKVYQVSCGFRNTFFLVENRKIYYTGYMESSLEQNAPTFFNTIEKLPELRNETEYSVIRILNTWNKSFSIFYVSIADSTMVKNVTITKLNQILNNLASKWDFKSILPPHIEAISGYFTSSTMKKKTDSLNNVKK